MRAQWLFFILFFLSTRLLFSQTNDDEEMHHTFGIKTGYMGFRMRDQVISSYVYQGGTVPIELGYGYRNSKLRFNASFTFMPTDTTDLRTKTLDGFSYKGDHGTFIDDTINNLDHSTVRTIYKNFNMSLSGKLTSFYGGKLRIFLGGNFTYLYIDKKFLSLFYANILTEKYAQFGATGSVEYDLHPKHRFRYVLTVPLLTDINRNIFLSAGDQYTSDYKKLTSLNAFLAFNSQLVYQFRFSRHWSLEAAYQFNYFQCTYPRKEQFINQSLTAGANFHF